MKKILLNSLWVAALAACIAGLCFVGLAGRRAQSRQTCEDLSVEFSDGFNFVTAEDIKGYIETKYGPFIGQRLDSLNLDKIENMLDRQSAVLKSEVYTSGDNVLHVKVSQREPVIRFQKGSDGFYIDDRGFIFPLQSNYTSQVPVIDGDIPVAVSAGYKGEASSEKDAAWLNGVLDLLSFIQGSKTWAENIVQIHVDGNGDIVLIPREGNEKFIFGSPHEAARKFARIEKYYQYVQPLGKEYGTVNVKYKGQIICK